MIKEDFFPGLKNENITNLSHWNLSRAIEKLQELLTSLLEDPQIDILHDVIHLVEV